MEVDCDMGLAGLKSWSAKRTVLKESEAVLLREFHVRWSKIPIVGGWGRALRKV